MVNSLLNKQWTENKNDYETYESKIEKQENLS